jgi:hypothetical protein
VTLRSQAAAHCTGGRLNGSNLFGCLSAAVYLSTSVFLSGIRLEGQTIAVAQVAGTVTDPSGAALANAQVIMTETDKGLAHTVLSDSHGQYVLANLPVGPYRLEVKASGFEDYVQDGIVLAVNNNIEVNVHMQIGSISEKVEVNATANMVETKRDLLERHSDRCRRGQGNGTAYVFHDRRLHHLLWDVRARTFQHQQLSDRG